VERRPLAEYPGPFPGTLHEAYAIQLEAISLLDRPVRGWKVARLRPDVANAWDEERIAGPVFDLWKPDGVESAVPVIERGYAAAEAEFQLQIGTIPERSSSTLDEAIDAIAAVAIGIEAAGSPYADINAHGPAVTVSDFGNNAGLVIGSPVAGDALSCMVSSLLNDTIVGTGAAAGPLESARFLFETAARYGLPLSPGQWISAGAITGAHQVQPGDRFEARFGDDGVVACRFIS
jgi:2-keto-4-pentenoate hydratase